MFGKQKLYVLADVSYAKKDVHGDWRILELQFYVNVHKKTHTQ